MQKIILDTNFLLIPYTLKVDIFVEIDRIIQDRYEICIIDRTIAELDNIIEKQKGKEKQAAKFAKELIRKKKIREIKTEESNQSVDEEILNLSEKEEIIVATQDKELKEKLKESGARVIILRQKSHLKLA
ncbi:hypothetical protein GF323_04890 [Candidatus Woesearchaeota archaeon]|nr:hypothetical protein [Candidatus Woesearchaeota archaeon]